MDLVYFSGGPRERVLAALLNAGHRVTHVYVNDPVRWPKIKKTIEIANNFRIPLTIIMIKNELENIIEEVKGKTCFSAGFNYIFPKSFIDSVALCLNVHGSLLPAYAGARTLSWVIVQGEKESGVTVHQVDAGVDTGPILLQKSFPLSPFETIRSLARKTGELEPGVVVEALELFEANGMAVLTPQPPDPLPLLPNRAPEHSEIDPSRPLTDLIDEIRASDPDRFPAWFRLHGQKVCIRVWRPDKPPGEEDLL